MNTLVIKSNCFSYNDISKMKNRRLEKDNPKSYRPDINIVIVFPSGHTEKFQSNKKLFDIINENDEESIIYWTKQEHREDEESYIKTEMSRMYNLDEGY